MINRLVFPVVNIIKYNPTHTFERRTLFFTWAANLFKPVAAVEASRILGYEYARVHNLFKKLEGSGVLTRVRYENGYSQVGSEDLPIYVRKDMLLGNSIGGSPPVLYVFKERLEIDMDRFVRVFNQDNARIWGIAASKILELARGLDSSYRSALLDDYSFICDKIGPVIRILQNRGTLFIDRKIGITDVRVRLRNETVDYRVPREEPFGRFL